MSAFSIFELIKFCFLGPPKNALKWKLCPLSNWTPNDSSTSPNDWNNNMFKISVIGETSVGSTSICKRFIHDEINQKRVPSMGPDCWVKELDIDTNLVNLQIWNIRGFGYSEGGEAVSIDKDWKPIKDYVCKHSNSVILVYDVTSVKTFSNLERYLNYLDLDKSVLKILVGNKIDLREKRVVSTEQGRQFAERNEMRFLETSALKNMNIEELFEIVSSTLIKRKNG